MSSVKAQLSCLPGQASPECPQPRAVGAGRQGRWEQRPSMSPGSGAGPRREPCAGLGLGCWGETEAVPARGGAGGRGGHRSWRSRLVGLLGRTGSLCSLAGRLPRSSPAVRAHASQGAGPELMDPKAAEGGLRGAPTLSPPGHHSVSISFLLSGRREEAEGVPAPCPPQLIFCGWGCEQGRVVVGGAGGPGKAGGGAWERPWLGGSGGGRGCPRGPCPGVSEAAFPVRGEIL